MLFNSLDFAIFFPIVFILYWSVSRKIVVRNVFILIVSYLFYGWWDVRFLGLIAFSSIVDYFIGRAMDKSNDSQRKKVLLIISLSINLGLLGFFKYFNFFVTSFVDAFQLFGSKLEISTLNIILPVGISFYTFQTLSYSIDIYKGKMKHENNVIKFLAFVSFFPQLVAGPIERASNLLPQFSKKIDFKYESVKSGLLLMCWGLFKKMVIADRVAVVVNQVYNNVDDYNSVSYILATVLFAFQIYCDFSGYSDIAIGAARTMGFSLMTNFRTPYFSKSITEFWRRWHISLSTWFRDYVYIPLGGNKKGEFRTYFNLFLVFLISGFWHGAAWNFIIWGAIHGVIIVLEKFANEGRSATYEKLGMNKQNISNKLFFTTITFSIVCIAWIFFRANTLGDSMLILSKIFDFNQYDFNLTNPSIDLFSLKTAILFILILVGIEYIHGKVNLYKKLNHQSTLFRYGFYLSALLVLIIFGIYGNYDDTQFIYFQF